MVPKKTARYKNLYKTYPGKSSQIYQEDASPGKTVKQQLSR
jgi:hypothetical protein